MDLSAMMLAFPFAAVAQAAGPSLLGLFMADKAEDEQQKMMDKQNQWERRQRLGERAYAKIDKRRDRSYAEALTGRDRAYAEKMLYGERSYTEAQNLKDRNISLFDKREDSRAFFADRRNMQKLSDSQAERSAASRGIDFQRMRDDAVAAGYSPMTALSMASAYSTEVGYGNTGQQYMPGPTGQVGQRAAPGAVVTSPPSGGFSSGGGGYSGHSAAPPVLATQNFLGEALEAGLSTYFNTVTERDDTTYQRIADQVASGQIARQVAAATPRQFGFSLSKVEPFKPSVAVLSPPFGGNGIAGATDAFHGGREIKAEPTADIGVTGNYDLGNGDNVRALGQGVEWSEGAQMVNEMYLGANKLTGGATARGLQRVVKNRGAGRKVWNYAAKRWEETSEARVARKTKPPIKPGTGAYALTGSQYVHPSFKW